MMITKNIKKLQRNRNASTRKTKKKTDLRNSRTCRATAAAGGYEEAGKEAAEKQEGK